MSASSGRGWIRLIALLVVGLVVAIAAMVLLRGRDWSTAENLRNYRELEIVGRAVEGWPKSIDAMARSNFVRSKVEAPKVAGGFGAVPYVHPELGDFRISYAIVDCGTAGAAKPDGNARHCQSPRYSGVKSADNKLFIQGHFDLESLVAAEAEAGNPTTVSRFLDQVRSGAAPVSTVAGAKPLLQYTVELSLEAIAQLAASAPDFETVLLVDQDGTVVASLGGKKLPVASIADIVTDEDDIGALLLTSAAAISSSGRDLRGSNGNEAAKPPTLRGNAEPVQVRIAGESYVLYVRPLNFPGDWRSDCGDAGPAGGGNGAQSAKKSCLLVGLARQGGSYSRSLSLSPDLLTLAAIFLTLAVALVPVMKLRFLGPAGHMSPLEVIAVIFGIVAAFALTVLAVVLVWNSLLAHARSSAKLEDLAKTMTDQFDAELGATLALQSTRTALFPPPPAFDPASVDRAAPTLCPPDAAAATGIAAPDAQRLPLASAEWVVVPALGGAGPWLWPLRESATLSDAKGGRYLGSTTISNRCIASQTRLEIANRLYFRNAMAGRTIGPFDPSRLDPPEGFDFARRYAIESIRSTGDGGNKTAIAVRFGVSAERLAAQALASDNTAAARDSKLRSGILLQTMVLRSFLAPVLPRSVEFIVVDAQDPKLPYVAGSSTHRIAIDGLGSAFATDRPGEAIDRAARTAHNKAVRDASGTGGDAGEAGDTQTFDAVFEGKPQKFVARGLKNTPWVLVLHQPQRDVDAQLASTASFAAAAWFGLALFGVIVMALAWLRWRKRSWLWLWPRPGIGPPAERAAFIVYAVLAVAMIAIVVPAGGGEIYKVWLAVLLPVIASAVAWHHIGRFRHGGTNAVLMPADERGHELLLVALFLSFGALPMLALWHDAKREVRAVAQNEEIVHIEAAWKINRAATAAVLKAIKLPERPDAAAVAAVRAAAAAGGSAAVAAASKTLPTPAVSLGWIGVPGLVEAATLEPGEVAKGFSSVLHDWANLGRPLGVAGCASSAAMPGDAVFCLDENGRAGLVENSRPPPFSLRGLWWPGVIGSLLALGGLIFVLRHSVVAFVRSLFGFGTPLEAVTYPTLARSSARLELPERAVVLNGPLALQLELLGVNDALDVGQTDAQRLAAGAGFSAHKDRLAKGGTVVVIGLETALRDQALCEAALQMLEDMSLLIDRQRRSVGVADGRVVVLTDLSPLDRILQAYEREQSESAAASGHPAISRQQQLRWSRLFEDFTTVVFRPTPKFLWSPRVEARYRKQLAFLAGSGEAGKARADGIIQLVREAHYLPEVVLNSLIDPRAVPSAATWKKLFSVTYPISVTQYGRLYARPIWAWAQAVRPATRDAAIDYLRGTLIEHYQHLWVASSRAERVILDNLARERVVNITAALALRSLIRRGLVVLDPEPKLINASFAAFVRQAERPEAMAMWRHEQGKSSWDKAALPLAILLPGAIIGLALLALLAGESFATVFPVILGVGPALLATFGGGRKPG